MDGWMDGWVDGWMDGLVGFGGWMDGWLEGWMDVWKLWIYGDCRKWIEMLLWVNVDWVSIVHSFSASFLFSLATYFPQNTSYEQENLSKQDVQTYCLGLYFALFRFETPKLLDLIHKLQNFISRRLFPPKPEELPSIQKCTWWIPSATKVLALLSQLLSLFVSLVFWITDLVMCSWSSYVIFIFSFGIFP